MIQAIPMSTIRIDQRATYLAAIKNSVGSKQFRNLIADVDGKTTDLMENGRLACAFYASWILLHFGLIEEAHATVKSTVKDLREHGWTDAKEPKEGDVLVWEATFEHDPNEPHEHIGFYIGNERAVSNSSKLGEIIEHHWTFEGQRPVTAILSRSAFPQSGDKTNG